MTNRHTPIHLNFDVSSALKFSHRSSLQTRLAELYEMTIRILSCEFNYGPFYSFVVMYFTNWYINKRGSFNEIFYYIVL